MSSRGGAAGTTDAFNEEPGFLGVDDRPNEGGVVFLYPPEMELSNRHAHSAVHNGESKRRGWTIDSDGWWKLVDEHDRSVWSLFEDFRLTDGRQQKLQGVKLLVPVYDSSDDVGAVLVDLLKHITHLTLSVRSLEPPEEEQLSLHTIYNAAPSTLTWLRLRSEPSGGKVEIGSLVEAMKAGKLTGIKSLFLEAIGLDSVDIRSFADVIRDGSGPNLSQLSLYHNDKISHLGHAALAQIMEAGHMRSLEFLDLARTGIGEASCEEYGKAVSSGNLSALKGLQLFGNKTMERGHVALAKGLDSGGTPALETLLLSRTGLEEAGCEAYSKSFSSGLYRSLKEIGIAKNPIRKGHVALAEGMASSGMPALELLNLSSSMLDNNGCAAYGKACSSGSFPVLKYLLLDKNDFSKAGLLALTKLLKEGHLNSLLNLDISQNHRIQSENCARTLLSTFVENNVLDVDILYEWHRFPDLDLLQTQYRERNRANAKILSELGPEVSLVPATFGKVYLCGNPEVGKTTLRLSLQRSFSQSLWTWEKMPRKLKRTRGIEISQITSNDRTGENPLTLQLWDLAGQEEYHLIHNGFLSDLSSRDAKATTFVVLCSSKGEKEKAKKELNYWFRFIASSCGKNIQSPRHVLVVVNCFNGDSTARKRTQTGYWRKFLESQQDKFRGHLVVALNPFVVDVRKRKYVQGLKRYLVDHNRQELQYESIPDICQSIQSSLSVWPDKAEHFPVVDWKEFVERVWVIRGKLDEKIVEAATKYLNGAGTLVYIHRVFPEWNTPSQRFIVLDPNWFCREVVGNMFRTESMGIPSEHLFKQKVDKNCGSISIEDFKSYFKEESQWNWTDSQVESLVAMLLWLGLCYRGRQPELFIPALIEESGTIEPTWDSSKNAEGQWVMGYSVEQKEDSNAITLAPIALWHKFQVELASFPEYNGMATSPQDDCSVPDSEFRAGKHFITFKANHMDVWIRVDASNEHPTFRSIDIFVKPIGPHDDVDLDRRKELQVDLASSLRETLQRLWNVVCPGVGNVHRVVWPWPARGPTKVMRDRNLEIGKVIKIVAKQGLGRRMQWMVDSDNVMADQLLSWRELENAGKSMGDHLLKLREATREAVKLGIFPAGILSEDGGSRDHDYASTSKGVEPAVDVVPQNDLHFSGKEQESSDATSPKRDPEMLEALYRIEKKQDQFGMKQDQFGEKLDQFGKKQDRLINMTHTILMETTKKYKDLSRKVLDAQQILLDDRQNSCPKFIYLGERGTSAWVTLKDAVSLAKTVHVHFLCEARHNDYTPHKVKTQPGIDVSKLKDWAAKIGPWLSVSLTILYVSAKLAANVVAPGAGLLIPDFTQWQQASSLIDCISLATGYAKGELYAEGILQEPAHSTVQRPQELYGDRRKDMTEFLQTLKPQKFREKIGLRKVSLKLHSGDLHGVAWICDECFEKFRNDKLVTEL